MRAIDLAGFEHKFAQDADPWSTWASRDEALKRRAILHALPPGISGRVLELGAGNGSNSRPLARRALRLDATEATREGTRLVARAVAERAPRARAVRLIVPAAPPRARYDAIVVAELLYYLDARAMRALARQVARRLRPGGVLVLAHHRITFYDFAQHADGIHERFLRQTGIGWRVRPVRRTGRWRVIACKPAGAAHSTE
ncbi:class I SAM-dependent methyltransferase [Sphingomonas profundi]|uniref:class I SAM-dependent methyltransferase n=1 Tax=Alterirhizorhabdus profundi TaxID=2681549 RepID=UPI0012E74653|nr:class I SAM-dependent methyltransferase [Sphingomonas profundi]